MSLIDIARRALLPAAFLILIGYFVFHAIGGPTGAIAWQDYKAERASLKRQAAISAENRAALDQEVKRLNPKKVDPDTAEVYVRDKLNMVKPDEVIVPLENSPGR